MSNILWSEKARNGITVAVGYCCTNLDSMNGLVTILCDGFPQRTIMFSTPNVANKIGKLMLEDFNK